MTLTEYFALAHGNQVALAAALGSHQPTVRQWAMGERLIPVGDGAAVTRQELFPDTWSAIWPELAAGPTDHGTKLRAAIAKARFVYETVPEAGLVIDYIEQLLMTGAPVPAPTGIAAGAAESAPVLTSWTDGAGNPLALGPDPMLAAARQAAKHHSDFDQAAAAMAAESAKKVADAEWFASRCTSAAPAPIDAASTPITIAHLVVEVDTTQLDAALTKAERLQVLLAGLRH